MERIEVSQRPSKINEEMIAESEFIEKYKEQMRDAILRIDPDIKPNKVDKAVDEYLLQYGMSPGVGLDNNYTEEYRETTLLSVLDWTYERKLVMGLFIKHKTSKQIQPIICYEASYLIERRSKRRCLPFQMLHPDYIKIWISSSRIRR